MVLYCMQHAANILRAIIHKFKYHLGDEAVFFVDKDPSSLYCPRIDKIKYYRMPDPLEMGCYSKDAKEVKKYTDKTIANVFREAGLDPLQFSHIYVLMDIFNPFTLYFELNSIKYMSIEITDNSFDFYATAKDLSRYQDGYAYGEIVTDMHLGDGCGKNCVKAYLFSDKSARNVIEKSVEVEVYGYFDALSNLAPELKRQLLDAYHIERCDFDAVMLLNSPTITANVAKWFESNVPYIGEDPDGAMFLFYKIIIDYYFGDVSFALKPHPQADEKWVKAFSEFEQLPREAPIELFFLLNKKFDLICPIVSSGLDIFKENDFNVAYFGTTIFNFIKQIHFVFLAFTLINAICPPGKILIHGIEPRQAENFINWAYKDFKDVQLERLNSNNVRNAVFIVAELSDYLIELIRSAPEDCLIIFNGNCPVDSNIFASQEMFCSIADVSGEEETEIRKYCWTVLSKNKELLDAVREFAVSYTLESSGLKIESLPRT